MANACVIFIQLVHHKQIENILPKSFSHQNFIPYNIIYIVKHTSLIGMLYHQGNHLTWDEKVHTRKSVSARIWMSKITPKSEFSEYLVPVPADWDILLSLTNSQLEYLQYTHAVITMNGTMHCILYQADKYGVLFVSGTRGSHFYTHTSCRIAGKVISWCTKGYGVWGSFKRQQNTEVF